MISKKAPTSRYDTILDVLRERAEELPDQLAYDYNGEEKTTFAEIDRDARALARDLAARGLGRSDFCAVITPMNLEQVRLVFAIQLTGAAPVLFDPAAPPKLLGRRLAQCRAKRAIVDAELIQPLEAELAGKNLSIPCFPPNEIERRTEAEGPELPTVRPEDTAYLQFTSGTTGEPKVVVITHRNLAEYLRIHYQHIGYIDEEVFLSWAPLFHDLGLVGYVFLPLYVGCPTYLLPPHMKSLGVWLQTASRVKATVTSGPDFGYRIVTRSVKPEGLDLSSLRMTGSGGEPVRLDTIQRFEKRFGLKNTSVGGYGQAESVMCISMGLPGEPVRTDDTGNVANGRVLPELEVRIVSEEGEVLPSGQVGEITVRGVSVFPGYLDDEEATRQTVRDGWLYTGDNGYLDAEGYLFILGRKKALIKRGGSFISPREVEMAADQVPGVRYTVAIGVAGSSSVASEDLVVLAEVQPEAVETDEQKNAVAEAIADAVDRDTGHAPADVILLKPRTIPRTGNGKIRYTYLKELVVHKDPRFEAAVI